jgi:hypothetical protein
LLKSRGPNSLDGFQDFNFETIPDGLTPLEGSGDVSQDQTSLSHSVRKNFLHPFKELVAKLYDSTTAGVTSPVTCLVSDFIMPFTIQVADELSLPILLFCPASASAFLAAFYFRTLRDKGVIPLKGNIFLSFFLIYE